MSGIAAIYDPRGLVERQDVFSLLGAIRHRGQSELTYFAEGIGLGQRLLATTPESLHECLPIEKLGGRYQVALDGRLDNREDLERALAIDPHAPLLTDPDLIVLSYDKWGAKAVERLVGDFAFVLWDIKERRLFAARDQRGFRPLVYTRVGNRTIIGSEPQQILSAFGELPRDVDHLFLSCHLTGAFAPLDRSPYAAISQLPPAHYLEARDGTVQVVEYWRFAPRPQLSYSRNEDYVEHFREQFTAATKAATRAVGVPGVLLSGGLDSSFVTACAIPFAPLLQAFAAFMPDGGGMDERPYSRAMAQHVGISLTEYDVSDCWSLSSKNLSAEDFDQPHVPVQAASVIRGCQTAHDAGVTVLLDGVGGDEVLSGHVDYMALLASRGHLLRAFAEARRYSESQGAVLSRVLVGGVLAPLVPNGIRHPLRALKERFVKAQAPSWIDQDALRFSGLSRALEISHDLSIWDSSERHRTLWGMVNFEVLPSLSWWDRRAASRNGIESRSPFLDLRVLEFALQTPQWLHRDGGRMKMILRAAMRGTVPDQIVDRNDKGVFNQLFGRGLLEEESGRVALSFEALGKQPYIKTEELYRDLEIYRSSPHPWWNCLWQAVTAGLWLQFDGCVPRSRN